MTAYLEVVCLALDEFIKGYPLTDLADLAEQVKDHIQKGSAVLEIAAPDR